MRKQSWKRFDSLKFHIILTRHFGICTDKRQIQYAVEQTTSAHPTIDSNSAFQLQSNFRQPDFVESGFFPTSSVFSPTMATKVPCYNCSGPDKGPICKRCSKDAGLSEQRSESLKHRFNQDVVNCIYLGQQMYCSTYNCWGVAKKKNTEDGRCTDCIENNRASGSAPPSGISGSSRAGSNRSRSPLRRTDARNKIFDEARDRNRQQIREHLARGRALVGSLTTVLADIEREVENL